MLQGRFTALQSVRLSFALSVVVNAGKEDLVWYWIVFSKSTSPSGHIKSNPMRKIIKIKFNEITYKNDKNRIVLVFLLKIKDSRISAVKIVKIFIF